MTESRASGPLRAAELMGLEQYARERAAFRARVLQHKRRRTVTLGGHLTFIFEDRLTIQYQVQEMLRIERIFEPAGIAEELAVYNPLIPDGGNWKATLLIEYPDVEERRAALVRLRGIEDCCYVEVAGAGRVVGVADEDLQRTSAEKTSAVHWLRFEISSAMKHAIEAGAAVALGTDHDAFRHSVPLAAATVAALARDLR